MNSHIEFVVQYWDQLEGWSTLTVYTSALIAMDLIAYMRKDDPEMKLRVLRIEK